MSAWTDVQQRWRSVSRREQRLLLLALGVVALALGWWLALAPALAVLKTAPQQHLALDAQMRQMLQLQAQVQALRAQPVINPVEARRALEASVQSLGSSAQLVLQMERAIVTLKGVAPEALAQWLAAARQNTHLVPSEAHLTRNLAGNWDGTLVLPLPQ
ncbi:MAG: type II secretion system protein M [Rhodoferax sp.]|nr:type II secretion system protein M [Betaproteobacteria bacterium]NCN96312.1 type II secretion system protein M [Rhodoferax sp.]OIP19848.1 MAG: general secretion pathway protein GspM [Comamonadaceae bacterium CG2_30_57_122]PIZ22180.1 MAG: general secretion pathway protein GspM [Comamonadaceae bacterium CG_4_10_14_0_8_um_filter_57_29]PJC20525.1 MAG: general secretion pathway protein GspM [Comamonadaceae bacterium CG_4_9_14_0_8_um_filter_57_21]